MSSLQDPQLQPQHQQSQQHQPPLNQQLFSQDFTITEDPAVFTRSRNRWYTNEEVASILSNFISHPEWQTVELQVRPKSGAVLIYSREKVRYRQDGYCWKKRKNGRTTREDHMKLKVQGIECIYGCYVHSAILPTFHRRCYWLLQNPDIVLVHYLNKPPDDQNKMMITFNSALLEADTRRSWTNEEIIEEIGSVFGGISQIHQMLNINFPPLTSGMQQLHLQQPQLMEKMIELTPQWHFKTSTLSSSSSLSSTAATTTTSEQVMNNNVQLEMTLLNKQHNHQDDDDDDDQQQQRQLVSKTSQVQQSLGAIHDKSQINTTTNSTNDTSNQYHHQQQDDTTTMMMMMISQNHDDNNQQQHTVCTTSAAIPAAATKTPTATMTQTTNKQLNDNSTAGITGKNIITSNGHELLPAQSYNNNEMSSSSSTVMTSFDEMENDCQNNNNNNKLDNHMSCGVSVGLQVVHHEQLVGCFGYPTIINKHHGANDGTTASIATVSTMDCGVLDLEKNNSDINIIHEINNHVNVDNNNSSNNNDAHDTNTSHKNINNNNINNIINTTTPITINNHRSSSLMLTSMQAAATLPTTTPMEQTTTITSCQRQQLERNMSSPVTQIYNKIVDDIETYALPLEPSQFDTSLHHHHNLPISLPLTGHSSNVDLHHHHHHQHQLQQQECRLNPDDDDHHHGFHHQERFFSSSNEEAEYQQQQQQRNHQQSHLEQHLRSSHSLDCDRFINNNNNSDNNQLLKLKLDQCPLVATHDMFPSTSDSCPRTTTATEARAIINQCDGETINSIEMGVASTDNLLLSDFNLSSNCVEQVLDELSGNGDAIDDSYTNEVDNLRDFFKTTTSSLTGSNTVNVADANVQHVGATSTATATAVTSSENNTSLIDLNCSDMFNFKPLNYYSQQIDDDQQQTHQRLADVKSTISDTDATTLSGSRLSPIIPVVRCNSTGNARTSIEDSFSGTTTSLQAIFSPKNPSTTTHVLLNDTTTTTTSTS